MIQCHNVTDRQNFQWNFFQPLDNVVIPEYLIDKISIRLRRKNLIEQIITAALLIGRIDFYLVKLFPVFKNNAERIFKFPAKSFVALIRAFDKITQWKTQETGLIRNNRDTTLFSQLYREFFQILVWKEILQKQIKQVGTIRFEHLGQIFHLMFGNYFFTNIFDQLQSAIRFFTEHFIHTETVDFFHQVLLIIFEEWLAFVFEIIGQL